MWHEEDDTLQKELEEEIELTEKHDLLNVNIANINNGEEPTSRWDLGRNCPRCSGQLAYKEHTERNQNVLLFCKSCGIQVFAEDIDYQDELSDTLYKTIPLKMRLYWQDYMHKYRKK